MGPLEIVLIAVGAVVLAAVMFAVGIGYRKRVGEREIGSAEAEATRIINEAIRSGESRKKEMLLEAKDEIHRSRTEHDKEVKERRAELSKQERRLQQKEETLDRRPMPLSTRKRNWPAVCRRLLRPRPRQRKFVASIWLLWSRSPV